MLSLLGRVTLGKCDSVRILLRGLHCTIHATALIPVPALISAFFGAPMQRFAVFSNQVAER